MTVGISSLTFRVASLWVLAVCGVKLHAIPRYNFAKEGDTCAPGMTFVLV